MGPNIRIRHDPTDVPSIYNGGYRHYYSSTKILGDASNLCSGTRTFSVKNISGATYVWTYSTSLSVIGPININQITVQRNGSSNGAGWVEVQISTSCSGTSATSTQNITVGKPLQPAQINVSLIDYTMGKIILMVDPVEGATSYNWYKNGTLHYAHTDVVAIPITKDLCNVSYGIEVEAVNSCGTSAKKYKSVFVPCEAYFTLFPNPASDEVIVSTNKTTNESLINSSFEVIRIYDITGTLKKVQQFNKSTEARLNISSLPKGNYYIEIINGEYKERHQLLIHR